MWAPVVYLTALFDNLLVNKIHSQFYFLTKNPVVDNLLGYLG